MLPLQGHAFRWQDNIGGDDCGEEHRGGQEAVHILSGTHLHSAGVVELRCRAGDIS